MTRRWWIGWACGLVLGMIVGAVVFLAFAPPGWTSFPLGVVFGMGLSYVGGEIAEGRL